MDLIMLECTCSAVSCVMDLIMSSNAGSFHSTNAPNYAPKIKTINAVLNFNALLMDQWIDI